MMIGRRLGIPGSDLSEASLENLDDLLEMVVETSQVFCSRSKPWHSVPQWLFCLQEVQSVHVRPPEQTFYFSGEAGMQSRTGA